MAKRQAVENFGIADTLTDAQRASTTSAFGGGFTHYLNNLITDSNGRGSFSFSGLETAQYVNGIAASMEPVTISPISCWACPKPIPSATATPAPISAATAFNGYAVGRYPRLDRLQPESGHPL